MVEDYIEVEVLRLKSGGVEVNLLTAHGVDAAELGVLHAEVEGVETNADAKCSA